MCPGGGSGASKGSPRNPAWAPQEHIFYRSRALDVADGRHKWCEPLVPMRRQFPHFFQAQFADASTVALLQPAMMLGALPQLRSHVLVLLGMAWLPVPACLAVPTGGHCHGHVWTLIPECLLPA